MGDFVSTAGGVPADLRSSYAAHKQDHVFKYVDSGAVKPGSAEMSAFIAQLRTIDPGRMSELHLSTTAAAAAATTGGDSGGGAIEPIESFGSVASAHPEDSAGWFKTGLKAVKDGKVAVVVLCGGQGTRLGFDGPKGMYDIGLPSGKTLFQLQAERLLRVCKLAAATETSGSGGGGGGAAAPRIPWYIMTSPLNDAATREFFDAKGYFGIPKEDLFFFAQGTLPCMTRDGKIILEAGGRVAMAPDGNGGIYPALQRTGALADMRGRGIEHVHVFSIDNALVRVADPHFLGYCIEKKADCGNKSVWKAEPGEKVGVVVKRGGKPCVVEYSEMTQDACERREPSSPAAASPGRLVFGAGNICNHYFSLSFLEDTVLPGMKDMYHVAHKKIPAADGPSGETKKPLENNGIKLESFIFDVFPLSRNMVLFEGAREDEFAPVKNAPGSSTDSPDTAREMISRQARRWVAAAGAKLCDDGVEGLCEISPLVSYGGEGLEGRVAEISGVPFHLE